MSTLWHGRFASGPSETLMQFTSARSIDFELAPYDVVGSRAHVRGLVRVGLLNDDEGAAIDSALAQVADEFTSGSFAFVESDEDAHSAIERRVTEIAGEVGGKLHTGRSRNDQCVTALRLYAKDNILHIAQSILELVDVLSTRAGDAGDAYVAGYTHLQRAQPILLAHYFAAHSWAFLRDVDRLLSTRDRLDVSPLGAGALAGSSLPLDPAGNAKDLGFASVFTNSLDVISDRDFVAEMLFDIAMVGIHLSRIGEEVTLWTSEEFGFMRLADAFATGSSMMPQKKNPDIAELARGKTGRLVGHLTGVLTMLKGLPLGYNRDLQEDKEPLFDSVRQISLALAAISGMLGTATYNTHRMQQAADVPTAGATDLAEWLVEKGTPFRQAHAIVGELVRRSIETDASLIDLVAQDERLGPDAASRLAPGVPVQCRTTPGGAGPGPVAVQLQQLQERIATDKTRVANLR